MCYNLPRLVKSIKLIKENSFTLKKLRSRRYPPKTIMNADYADDLTLLANTPAQTECLLHCLEQQVRVNGL